MKIISWNVNGIRAAQRKGFLKWFNRTNADIVCLQEVKAHKEQLVSELVQPEGYYAYFNTAVKKGYSGVSVYSKAKPLSIGKKLGVERFDTEGRILRIKYPNFSLINLYLPHGGRQKENLGYKLEVYDALLSVLKRQKKENLIIIGDFNIAHQEIDLARPKQNKKNIMFTPEERSKVNQIVELGFADTFRRFYQKGGYYTWWPYMANARKRNLGWRIDYAFASKKIASKIKNAFILKQVKGSDHCPIGIEI